MYLWKIEYNAEEMRQKIEEVVNCFKLCTFERLNTTVRRQARHRQELWIALNYVPLKDWIQHRSYTGDIGSQLWIALNYVPLKDWIQLEELCQSEVAVVNCFKLCTFERLNTTVTLISAVVTSLWIALNYVPLKDWIQLNYWPSTPRVVVNCFKLCTFERLNTTKQRITFISTRLWIALNYVSLRDWIQHKDNAKIVMYGCESL